MNTINIETLIAKQIKKRFSVDKGIGPVDLVLETNKIYSIIGPNASGKTTLIRSLCKLEELDSGTIKYSLTTDNHENKLLHSAVFQQADPWPHLTVLDNIVIPLKEVFHMPEKIAISKAETELERFGLKDYYKSFPHQLSGGLRQRVVQARTFAMKPKFMYLDEPTSALDPEWTDYFGQIVREYAKEGNMVLIIAHQMNFLKKISDYVYFLDNGYFLESGEPKDFFENPKNKRLIHFLENS